MSTEQKQTDGTTPGRRRGVWVTLGCLGIVMVNAAISYGIVQVQQDALLVVDRQMSYMRQQLSARMLSRYQNNYHFGGGAQ